MIVLVLPDIPAEDRLLERARRGDADAIMQIYEGYFSPIYQFIRLRVEDRLVAEDLASNVFLKFIEAVRRHKAPNRSLRGWLFQVARSELYQHLGKRQKFPTTTLEEWAPSAGDEDLEAQLIRSMNAQRARQALRDLTDEQQEVLILRFGQQLSLEDTADVMGRSVSAVKSLQFRAVNALRQLLTGAHMELGHE